MLPVNDAKSRFASGFASEIIDALCIPMTSADDFGKVGIALTNFLQYPTVPVDIDPELTDRISSLKELIEKLGNSLEIGSREKYKIFVTCLIAKKIRDIQSLSEIQKKQLLGYRPVYFFANDNACYGAFRRIVGYLHYPDTNEKFTINQMHRYFEDFLHITKVVTPQMIKSHLYRLNGNHAAWREFKKIKQLTVQDYRRIHEITKLLFLKYRFGDNVDQPTLHYEVAHTKAIEIENFHLMMQAKQSGVRLSLKSLEFVRILDKLDLIPPEAFYSEHRFQTEKLRYNASMLPDMEEMNRHIEFLQTSKLWEYFRNGTKRKYSHDSIENFVWRNWFLAYFSTHYPVGNTEGFAYILMRMELENFFERYKKSDLFMLLTNLCWEFVKHERGWEHPKDIFILKDTNGEEGYITDYFSEKNDRNGLWRDFSTLAAFELLGKKLSEF